MSKVIRLEATIPERMAGMRLDQVLAELFPEHSRTRLQMWIKNGHVRVNNINMRQRDHVAGSEHIEIAAAYDSGEPSWAAENIPLNIIHEDNALLILNKPAGLVVHPGAGNREHTLLNALLHYEPKLEQVSRAGIVQRLDKDTSGLMVIARTMQSHTYLVKQLQNRKIKREYHTIVSGVMTAGGTIDKAIGRHPKHRTRMAVIEGGKPAISHYRIIRKYPAHTLIKVQLETGRTHQIRVHMAYLNYPIVGDAVYGKRIRIPKGASPALISIIQSFPRQALHASRIELLHPMTKKLLRFEAPLPDDINVLLSGLEKDAKINQ